MKILYLSCHSVLEYDELVMLTEIEHTLNPGFGIEVFSLGGAFQNPTQSGDYMRSVIPHGKFYPELYAVAMQCDKDNIHDELLQWCDVVLFMHNPSIPGQKEQQRWLVRNWEKIKKYNKKAIWRSIGQSVPAIEKELQKYRAEGLKIVRYSPMEKLIPDYAGEDAMIRFDKDPGEFVGWTGEKKQVLTFAQSFKKRGDHLGYALYERVTAGFNKKVYGTENEDLGEVNGGTASYEELKKALRESRAFYYFGTIPAPYTLSIMEAMMTGIPVVAPGPELRAHPAFSWPCYEIPDIIENGLNGYVSNNIAELSGYIQLLMDDETTARRIGEAGRRTAIRLWGKEDIMAQWSAFLKTLL